jgi:DNA-binding response OmpR family regulator
MARVLVIDDNEPFLRAIGFFLDASGYETVMAENGRAGLKCFLEQPPDIVVLDVELSDVPGLKLCTMLRERAAGRDLPVIMMTGQPRTEIAAAAAEAGACEVMTKPFELEDLRRSISRHAPAGSRG